MASELVNIYNIFNIFRHKYLKIYPENNTFNKEITNTEYQDLLNNEFKRKFEFKQNKKSSALRIRGSSF